MKILYRSLTVVMVVVSLLVCAAAVGYVMSPRFQMASKNYVVENTNPEFVEWVEVFQNQLGVIVSGNERERLESKLNHYKELELALEEKIFKEVNQTPWSRMIHGNYKEQLKRVKSTKGSVKISLLWVKTKDKLKFW
jgi:cell shape-determining protein MreC